MAYNFKDQCGSKNVAWLGDKVGYFGIHLWLRKKYPKPNNCQKCNKKTEILDLANITGVYKRNIKNFLYLCKSCHNKQDEKFKFLGPYSNIKGGTHLANLGRKKNGKYKYAGIFQVKKSKKFHSSLMFKRKKYYLGAFETQELAFEAYTRKRLEIKQIYGV